MITASRIFSLYWEEFETPLFISRVTARGSWITGADKEQARGATVKQEGATMNTVQIVNCDPPGAVPVGYSHRILPTFGAASYSGTFTVSTTSMYRTYEEIVEENEQLKAENAQLKARLAELEQ
jgi:hypothetical protein